MAVETPSPQDATIWCFQSRESPLQLGAVCIFDGAPMRDEAGALRVAELRRQLDARIAGVPRLRQRLVQAPLGQGPLLVDDPGFDIARHVRVTALPRPGTREQLQAFAAGLLESSPAPDHPLWEFWLVDGLEGDRVALVVRASHVLADGIALSRLVLALLDREPTAAPLPSVGAGHLPAPGPVALLGSALEGRVRRLAGAARGLGNVLVAPSRLAAAAGALVRAGASVLVSATSLPITAAVGPRRAVAWTSLPLAELSEVRRAAHCTLNDVVLAVVGSAVERYLARTGDRADDLRVVVPVGTARTGPEGQVANDFSMLFVDVPLGPMEPLERVRRVAERTRLVKGSPQARVGPVLFGLGGVVPSWVLRRVGPTLLRRQPFAHLVVTNVRGTTEPRYLMGGRMLEVYPLVGVTANIAVIVGVASYEDRLGVGVTVDPDVVPDVQLLVDDLSDAAAELVGTGVAT